jgi:hypothetical protein
MELMYGEDNVEEYLRQLHGISVYGNLNCYDQKAIDKLRASKRLSVNESVPVICLGIDTAKGGDRTGVVGVMPILENSKKYTGVSLYFIGGIR